VVPATPAPDPRADAGPGVDERLRALGSRTRREILALVWDRELAAGEIAAEFRLRQATISEHLGVLRRAGLVEMAKVGTSRRYRARREALAGLQGALDGAAEWQPATDLPERDLSQTVVRPAVIASVRVPTPPAATFEAFTDAALYSQWLQAPVTIDHDGRFAATMEWGTEVRGRYEQVLAPHLIVMAWDFDDDTVPVPGRPLTGYLRVHDDPPGSRVEVHQLVDSDEQARFMQAAWGMVLGRLVQNLPEALVPGAGPPYRPRRPKRTG
jgi:DNA-binding transcriptional ArsR family regulator/uncharacterized protein YndB with AHSA1/START domain